jgi:uncharacterized protein YkwD
MSDLPPDQLTPYKGLVPYSEQDAPFFFGREDEQAIITANLLAARLTVLYGPSGAGKSSVLRAGVEHTLREYVHRNLKEHGEPELAVVVFNNWRDDPVAGLSRAVEETVKQTLTAMGQADDSSPVPNDLVQNLEALTKRINGELLIILDQLEEYFLYHTQEDGEGTFAVEFPRAVNRAGLRVNFLVALREDALSKLDRFKGRIPNLFDNYLRIAHLTREAARDAIEKPLEEYNRRQVNEAARVTIEPALVEVVLSQVQTGRVTLTREGSGGVGDGHQPATATIETSYLQLVMTRLWDEEMQAGSHTLRLATLDRLKGAEHIVRTHLDSVMAGLSPDERDIAAEVFRYLVTPSGTKIAYTIKDLVDYTNTPNAQLTPVLERLAGSGLRILRTVDPPPDQPRETRYEIFHDVLAPAILDWRTRYVQEKEKREIAQRLAEEAEKQRASELEAARQRELEAEAKAGRRLRRLTAALIVVSIFAVIAAVLALRNSAYAETQRVVAEQLRVQAEADSETARMYEADYSVTLLRSLNDMRQTEGLPPLELKDDLSRVAQAHSKFMAKDGVITHTDADGSTSAERIAKAGYGAGHPQEVIFGGTDVTFGDAITWWTTSPVHRAVLLDPANTVVGIGIYKSGDATYYTFNFGKPAK